jgi:hypothetical protein
VADDHVGQALVVDLGDALWLMMNKPRFFSMA